MAEESWHQARLIPTSGINGAEEQERRATSALLAVLGAVKEFGRAVTVPLGAPAGAIETYIEVPFPLGDRTLRPDGLIRVKRGSKSWIALVEVKTGSAELAAEQLENYLDIARENAFDAVVTISNEIPAIAGTHPTKVDGRKLRRVTMHHLSWSEVLCAAVMQKEHRGVADPDQAWILGELIRYLEHPRSGALAFNDMGESWVKIREAISAGTLRVSDSGLADVAGRWDALLRYTSLQLGRQLGDEVIPVLTRKELADPVARNQSLTAEAAATGALTGRVRVPNVVGELVVTADLRAGNITVHMDVLAPGVGRATSRVNWLVRQLSSAPPSTRVEAFAAYARGPGSAELLSAVREDPSALLLDRTKELKSFRVATVRSAGTKRGTGRGSFIESVINATNDFYGEIAQSVRAWQAKPPQIRPTIEIEEPVALASTAQSSQDGPISATQDEERSENSAEQAGAANTWRPYDPDTTTVAT
ncbi:hypothetical protein [Luteipulveratus mongoliensis]|uniref:hypothetical protein n=1 Tax=Luteipulveratus mongoliensis TaxID=571913 RepID=UPI000B0E7827|nr:hypothetical protein [Luteipulveratus mongoliensis]